MTKFYRNITKIISVILFFTLLINTSCKFDDSFLKNKIEELQNQNDSLNTKIEHLTAEYESLLQEQACAIKSFVFRRADNSQQLNQDVYGVIHGTKIFVQIPNICSDKNLKPTIELASPQQQIVDGKESYDFSKPVTITVADIDGQLKEYTVDVISFTGLPILSIKTADSAPIESKENYLDATYTLSGDAITTTLTGSVQIRGRGNSTWYMPKKPYQIKFDKKTSLFGWPQGKVFVLLANYADKSKVRTSTAFAMSESTSLEWTPRSEFVELIINDVYLGTYQLCEKIKTDKNRVNVGNNGYILEVDQPDRLDEGDVFFNTTRLLVNIKEPELSEGDAAYQLIKDYVNNVENVLYSNYFLDSEMGYKRYIDIQSFVDWYLVNEITKNNDAVFYSSVYMNKTIDGKLKMGPVWDFDISLGNVNYNSNWDYQGFWIKNAPWISRMFEDPEFVQLVKERYSVLYNDRNRIIGHIAEKADHLKYSVIEDNNKWQTLYNATWPNYAIMGNYDNEVQYLKDWLLKRMDWLNTALQ